MRQVAEALQISIPRLQETKLKTWQQQGKGRGKSPTPGLGRESGKHAKALAGLPSAELADLVQQLTEQMHSAAAELQFEVAARLRDEVAELKKELRAMLEATK